MCGIGLHAVSNIRPNYNSHGNDDSKRLPIIHQDHDNNIIRTCLTKAIESRGPDVPQSVLHRSSPLADWDIYVCASLLSLRGSSIPTVQPYSVTHSNHHFALCWNGELYSMTNINTMHNNNLSPSSLESNSCRLYDTARYNTNDNDHETLNDDGTVLHSLHLDSYSSSFSSSDTQIILDTLLQSAFSNDDSITNPFQSSETLVKVARTMSTIQGEYAFVLWVHPESDRMSQLHKHPHHQQQKQLLLHETNNNQGSIYFARDPLGRKSLLIHHNTLSPSSANNTTTSITSCFDQDKQLEDNPITTTTFVSSLTLSSVALTEFFIYGQDAVLNQGDSAKTLIHPMEEVIPGRIYHLELSTGILSYVPIPTRSNSSYCPPKLLNCGTNILHTNNTPRRVDMSAHTFVSPPSLPSSLSTYDDNSFSQDISSSTLQATEKLYQLLHVAVRRRVVDLSSSSSWNQQHHKNNHSIHTAKVAVLFSGGLDSVVLTAISNFHIPIHQYIDLINVSFASSSTPTTNPNTSTPNTTNDIFASPDRIAAIQSFHELSLLFPQRKWRLILVDVLYSEVLEYQTRIRTLIHPLCSTMDFNIGTAMWFASRGKGIEYTNTYASNRATSATNNAVTSDARIILVGIGADEQMAGYGRHRSVYNRGGYDALRNELKMEKSRLWTRNLGRDDRIISDHGKEARLPYLDEDVVHYLNSLDAKDACDMSKPPGVGDKLILRLVAHKMGLSQCSGLVKRAIQFGSRIAKVSDVQRFGSSQKAEGWKTFQ